MSEPPPTLAYEAVSVQRLPVPKWVWTVIAVYAVFLIGFLTLPAWAGWLADDRDITWFTLAVVGGWTLCGLALLMTPVRLARHRPLTRKSYAIPMIIAGLLMGVLLAGAGLALGELLENQIVWIVVSIGGCVVWIAWTIIWTIASADGSPTALAARFHRWLLGGSAAELLVAVPCHVIVRRRDECCAGMMTGTAICLGAMIMFLAFGPSVLLLYLKRARGITPALLQRA